MLRMNFWVLMLAWTLVGCGDETATETSTEMPAAGSGTDMGTSEEHSHADGEAHDHDGFALSGQNTQVLFTGVKKSGDSHSGGFKSLAGHIHTAEGAVTGISVVMQTESLFSDDERLTGHLKNEDFFSVAEFPEMKFESTKVEGSGDVTVTGNLTMHGETAEISFPATVSVEGESVKLTSEFKVDRTKFGMNYVGKPDDPINAEVEIKIIVGG